MKKLIVVALAGIMLCPQALAAETIPQNGVNPGTEVSVTLRDKTVITGRLDYVGSHSLFVVDSRTQTVTQVPYRNISQLTSWSPGKKTRIIILTAIGVGLALAMYYTWANAQ